MWISRRFRLLASVCSIAVVSLYLQSAPWLGAEPPQPASDFIQFVDGLEKGSLQVALTTYLDAKGTIVDLVGAVHVGDTAYYQNLNEHFKAYDAVLFEMVGDPGGVHREEAAGEEALNAIHTLQETLTRLLELDYQLDAIDYTAANFVHADLTLEEFTQLQKERGETIFTFIFNMMRAQLQVESEGGGAPRIGLGHLIYVFLSKDRASAFKLLLAEQMAEMEGLLGAAERIKGSVVVTERNKRVIEVLDEQVGKAAKRIAVFFGAGHYVDLEQRLRDLGYRKIGQTWLTAWDIPKPK